MTWNNGLEDPSFVAERLVYHVFRAAGLPAPRANNAVVVVNGETFGVYVNVETEDKTFLSRWFASNDGNLYEEQGQELWPGSEYGFELETNEALDDRSDLTALFAAIEAASDDTLLDDLAAVLDTARFLRYSAAEGIVNQWDGYAYTRFGPNDFRLYADPTTGRFSFLPWGMDMAMKPYGGETTIDLRAPTGMLNQRCQASVTCQPEYEAAVAEITDLFGALDLPALAQRWHDQIAADVEVDPRREVDLATFEDTFQTVLALVRDRPADVRASFGW